MRPFLVQFTLHNGTEGYVVVWCVGPDSAMVEARAQITHECCEGQHDRIQSLTARFSECRLQPKLVIVKHGFTVADGLAVQRAELNEWHTKLSTECYQAVCIEAAGRWTELGPRHSGHDVWRGCAITKFIVNWRDQR